MRSPLFIAAIFALGAAELTLTGCPPRPVSSTPDADFDGGLVIVGADAPAGYDASPIARAACSVLCEHGCEECTGKDGGRSCVEQFDHDRAGSGGAFDLRPECIADAGTGDGSLDALRRCGTVKCRSGR